MKLVVKRSNADNAPPLIEERLIPGSLYSIGSGPNANLRFNSAEVAPEQAVVMEEYGRLMLVSTADGTRFNGESLGNQARREITHGAELHVAGYVVSFLFEADERPAGYGESFPPAIPGDGRRAPASNPMQAPPPAPAQPSPKAPQTGVKAFLANIHNEDYVHKYYFFIQGGVSDGERIMLNSATAMLGWDETGQSISSEPAPAGVRAVVQFNVFTSEVVVNPQGPGMVAVNNVLIDRARTLSEGDELRLAPTPITEPPNMAVLVFHEPAVVDLFSARNEKRAAEAALVPTTPVVEPAAQPPAAPPAKRKPGIFSSERKFFGYFSALSIITFIFVILLTSALTYFLLEALFPA
ncbi:MAG TPA: hypothetical protein VGB73_09900 [Pyrinomonadaceae bacterium]|jgi:hypothetical protein